MDAAVKGREKGVAMQLAKITAYLRSTGMAEEEIAKILQNIR